MKIEQILEVLPPFTTMANVKPILLEYLGNYNNKIQELKHELDTSSEHFDAIKKDLEKLKDRCCLVNESTECDICYRKLVTRQFHCFPCKHSFHSDCLYNNVTSTNLANKVSRKTTKAKRTSKVDQYGSQYCRQQKRN